MFDVKVNTSLIDNVLLFLYTDNNKDEKKNVRKRSKPSQIVKLDDNQWNTAVTFVREYDLLWDQGLEGYLGMGEAKNKLWNELDGLLGLTRKPSDKRPLSKQWFESKRTVYSRWYEQPSGSGGRAFTQKTKKNFKRLFFPERPCLQKNRELVKVCR